jgi:glycerophosphoryl diester phosphodiesterase
MEGRVLNVAHRGARSLAPENTMAAARKALEAGADMWELDVTMSSDGELVVVHDNTLERTSNVKELFPSRRPWRVQDFTLAEIKRMDFGSWFNRSDPFGQIKSGAVTEDAMRSYGSEPAPVLGEALRFTLDHDWLVNIEIKDLSGTPGHASVVQKVIGLVESLGMAGRVIVSSFNHDYLRLARSLNPQIALGALVSKRHPDPVMLLQELDACGYHPRVTAIGLKNIGYLRDRGVHVLVWVANDEPTMRRLIRSGVSGIFTDFPQLLEAVLADDSKKNRES